jgi:hypothetical protein
LNLYSKAYGESLLTNWQLVGDAAADDYGIRLTPATKGKKGIIHNLMVSSTNLFIRISVIYYSFPGRLYKMQIGKSFSLIELEEEVELGLMEWLSGTPMNQDILALCLEAKIDGRDLVSSLIHLIMMV